MVSKKKIAIWNSCTECGILTDWNLPGRRTESDSITLKEWNEIVGDYIVYVLAEDGVVYVSTNDEDCCLCDKHQDYEEYLNEEFKEENSSLWYVLA